MKRTETMLHAVAASTVFVAMNVPEITMAASILIWPVDPVIDARSKATQLWLENHGDADVVLQTRVVSWTQNKGADVYSKQSAVVASPPIVRIPAKAKQLVRLIRVDAVREQNEQAYRVLLDEIPAVQDEAKEEQIASGIRFRMRYSIPLFTYGEHGAGGKQPIATPKPDSLFCTISSDGRTFSITNSGDIHARLTNVRMDYGKASVPLTSGQLGYVLSGSTMTWQVPKGGNTNGNYDLVAGLAGKKVHFGACEEH